MAKELEQMSEIVQAVRSLSHAVTTPTVGNCDAADVYVESLTEAVMGVTAGLIEIARAIERFTDVFEASKTE
jgi:hypothetical protein